MAYNPATDFLALWRNIAGQVSKVEMPGLDHVVAALARAGLITVSVSATAPVVNQSITAWLRAAVPSNSAEGVLFLWDKVTTAYLAATPALFLQFLEASAGESGISWWTSAGGPPANIVGNNGDFAVRTDTPFGIYGPKALGAWPATPIPGTADVITSTSLDNTFGTARGSLITRGPAVWQALPIGGANSILNATGPGDPAWNTISTMLDAVFGNVQGSILYRGAGVWDDLGPDTAGKVLQTNGAAANPSWAPRTAEFASGTSMVFRQTAAPTGWTKQVAINDYGLRVTSGAVGTTPGSAFSTVFAQSAVGNTTIATGTMPSHAHTGVVIGSLPYTSPGGATNIVQATVGGSTSSVGGDGPHTHSVNLTLAYTDVIIASKD